MIYHTSQVIVDDVQITADVDDDGFGHLRWQHGNHRVELSAIDPDQLDRLADVFTDLAVLMRVTKTLTLAGGAA